MDLTIKQMDNQKRMMWMASIFCN